MCVSEPKRLGIVEKSFLTSKYRTVIENNKASGFGKGGGFIFYKR